MFGVVFIETDDDGRIIRVEEPNSDGVEILDYEYHENGELKSYTKQQSGKPASRKTIAWDEDGVLVRHDLSTNLVFIEGSAYREKVGDFDTYVELGILPRELFLHPVDEESHKEMSIGLRKLSEPEYHYGWIKRDDTTSEVVS